MGHMIRSSGPLLTTSSHIDEDGERSRWKAVTKLPSHVLLRLPREGEMAFSLWFLRFRAQPPQADQRLAAADAVGAEVAEAFGGFLAAFGDGLLDDIVARHHGGAHQAAQLLDAAGDVDGVADHGELEALIGADVAEGRKAEMQADADADAALALGIALLVPAGELAQNLAGGGDGVGG